MKYFSYFGDASHEAIELYTKKRHLTALHNTESYEHSIEDAMSISDKHPIFVVSDGVTLNCKEILNKGLKYPNPSPAGDVAKIFCKGVVEEANNRYEALQENDIKEIFATANNKVGEYNRRVGKSDICGNKTGYYSATGSFVVIKDDMAFWMSICDSFVAHFDGSMNLKFMSSGVCEPYAVINGEEHMTDHIESGVLSLNENDRVFIFTDGFEHYVKLPEFLEIFKSDDGGFKDKMDNLSEKMNLVDPEKFGHERTLISITA